MGKPCAGSFTNRGSCNAQTKQGDLGGLVIPCSINSSVLVNSLADSGASVNLLPLSLLRRLQLGAVKPVTICLEFVDGISEKDAWILENAEVRVRNLTFLTDFIVVDVNEQEDSPIILGRPFLHTADATLHLGRQEISIGDGKKRVTFPVVREQTKSKSNRETIFRIESYNDILDNLKDLIDRSELNRLTTDEEEEESEDEDELTEEDDERLWPTIDVYQFEQEWDEEIDDAWRRMRDLFDKCPEGTISDESCLEAFYNGLCRNAQKQLDEASKGSFLAMTISDRFKMLLEKSYEYSWQSALLGHILNFRQSEFETLDESWERMKRLVEECSFQDFTRGTILRSFYMGLVNHAKETLDQATDEGFLMIGDDEAFTILETKAYLITKGDETMKEAKLIKEFEKFSMIFRSSPEKVVEILRSNYLGERMHGIKRDYPETVDGGEDQHDVPKRISPNPRDTYPGGSTS